MRDAPPRFPTPPASVLVVDDESLYLDSVRRILEPQNLLVTTASDGAQALKALQHTKFDVILLDLMMPGTSGHQVLDHVANCSMDTAIIIVSATDSVTEATDALLKGAQDFLRKPYAVNDLLLSVQRALWTRKLKQERNLLEKRLRESEHQYRFVVDNTPDLVFTLDSNGRIVFLNKQFATLLGLTPEDLKGLPFTDIVGDADREKFHQLVDNASSLGRYSKTIELRLNCPKCTPSTQGDPVYLPFEINISRNESDPGESNGFFGSARDISARKVAEARIHKLAFFDHLTELPNRQLFSDRIRQSLQRARREGKCVGLLFLDLDQFKYINDTLGHGAGDCVLKEVSQRLVNLIRKQDSIARMGGDEFTILIESIKTAADAGAVARKIQKALNRPLTVEGHRLHVGVSIGISIFPQDGEDEESLVKNADVAMYRAKREGRNNYQFYTEELTEWMLNRLGMELRLRDAITEQHLRLFYQPQYDLRTGLLTGMEALVRWQDPEEGLMSPERFLPIAEESGLIIPLGDWVLNQACMQAKAWEARGFPFKRIAVNLSTKQLVGHDIVRNVCDVLANTGLAPGVLELEITENFFLEPNERSVGILEKLHSIGVTLSIDDFGTGYSSLSMLKHLPIDKLKIDKAFVRDVPLDRNDKAIVKAILAMGKSLGLDVIAEGVETEVQRHFLQMAGCKEAQGFLFSRPITATGIKTIKDTHKIDL